MAIMISKRFLSIAVLASIALLLLTPVALTAEAGRDVAQYNPVISSITPTSGSPGTIVTINGSGFGDTRDSVGGPSHVEICDSAVLDYPAWTNTEIKAIVPWDTTPGPGPVTVIVGKTPSNSDKIFNVTYAVYFAEGTCRPNFDTYFCIQNPGSTAADVTLTYMKGDGTTTSDQLVVAPNSRSTVTPRAKLGTGDDAAHDFSTRIECTNGQQIVAERPMYFNYNGVWTGGHVVMGLVGPGSSYVFAEGTCRPNFDTYFCIQNPGSTVANVNITYTKGDGTNVEDPVNIDPHSRATINPRVKLGTGDDAAHDFSTSVSCEYYAQAIIVERPMYFNYKGIWTGGHDVMGTSWSNSFFAEGTCRPGFDTYICLYTRLFGHDSSSVTITYMKGDGATVTQVVPVGNSRKTIRVKDVLGEGDDAAHDFSFRVEMQQPTTSGQRNVNVNIYDEMFVERPMYFNYNGVWTGGHDATGAGAVSSFYFAEGTCRPNFDTYFCILNPGDYDADITITYMKGDGTTVTQQMTVPRHSRSTVNVRSKLGQGDDAAHDFSTRVECTNGQKIIVERPMYFNYKGIWTGGHDVVGFYTVVR